jgi:hypothetical protein
MHKLLIYLSIYFCLTCFGLSFSPSSDEGAQFRQGFQSPGYGISTQARIELLFHPGPGADTIRRRLEPRRSFRPASVMPKHVGATIYNYHTEWIIGVFVGYLRIFLLGILIFKGLNARRLSPFLAQFLPLLTEVSYVAWRGAPREMPGGTKGGAQRACTLKA